MNGSRRTLFAGVLSLVLVAGCAQVAAPTGLACGTFGAYTDAFPTPVNAATSPFSSVDDAFLEVAFSGGFVFPFYGTEYASVFLNTNGGLTFDAGNDDYDVTADDVVQPAIAPVWGDLDAGEAPDRANQMRWRQSDSCFEVAYTNLNDHDEATWANTATLTLVDDGRIQIAYGTVESEDILVGVFDGTHSDDRTLAVQETYDLSDNGTGVLLYDHFATGGSSYDGGLDGNTILFRP